MILRRLVVGPIGTNCYIFGSDKSKEVIIIDPGGDANRIIEEIDKLDAKPNAILLTHGHFDHTLRVSKLIRYYKIPLMYNKKEFDTKIYTHREADNWLKEGDSLRIGEITLFTLETPGHSPGALSFYSKDINKYNDIKIDGVIFTGDLLFKGSIGRSDIQGGNEKILFNSIRTKIMYNKDLTDNFLICPGHMDLTTIGEERRFNPFKQFFL